jgi:ATP-binding cassette subfamily F protein 3
LIQLAQLSKSFGERVLLDHVTWQITPGERVGLCGPNGAGKTTLLKMLAGMESPDEGDIIKPAALTIGYLPQDGLTYSGRTLFDEASLAFEGVLAMRAEIAEIETKLEDPSMPDGEHERLLTRYAELNEDFRREEGFSIDLRVATVLGGLGFSKDDFDKNCATFSGGWQMRIALAKLLLGRPTLLLLDEPTNHLDLDARNWLEEYLGAYPHAVILVSHDRYFLDAVVTRIADLSLRTITDYPGNYSSYVAERDARLERLRESKRRQDEEVARVQAFINRFRYQATKAAQVQSRIKMLEKVEPIEVPPERKRVRFSFPACPKSGRTVLDLKGARKAYGSKVVLDGINLHIERGDRVALVAPNGAGKSTLMRLLAGVEPPDAGERLEGHQVVMQYFAQDEAAILDPALTVYETLESGSPLQMVPAIRNILGGFLFSGDDIYKKAGVLSGGERTRLAVARMLLRPANTLLLDEPTNHLDLDSKDVLLDALEDFGGTLIFVSHDRYFVERLATKIVEVGHGHIEVYPGTYKEFLWHKAHGNEVVSTDLGHFSDTRVKTKDERLKTKERPKPQEAAAAPAPKGAEAHAEKKKQDAEDRKKRREDEARQKRVADLESRIAERENEVRALEAKMAAPGFYDDADGAKRTIARHQQLMWEVGDLMNQWEALQAAG